MPASQIRNNFGNVCKVESLFLSCLCNVISRSIVSFIYLAPPCTVLPPNSKLLFPPSQESGTVHRRRPRRRQLLDARVGPGPDGAGGVQLRRGDAAVPGGGRGARAADGGHALFRLLGMDSILSFCMSDLQDPSKIHFQGFCEFRTSSTFFPRLFPSTSP